MRIATSATVCLFLYCAGINANEKEDAEVIEIYGNFQPSAVSQMVSPVFVLSAQDIRSIVGSTALDVLAQVPSVTIKKSGAVQEIFLRGAETNFVIVQIDGVQVNNPLDTRGGSFDLASISKSALQRVEVIKGAQSSIYGSDAIAGVINLVTFTPGDIGTELSVGVLPKGQKVASVNVGADNLQGRFSYLDTDKQANGDQQESLEFALQGDFVLMDNSSTRLNARYSDYKQWAYADQSGGIVYAPTNPRDEKRGELVTASVRHTHEINSWYELAAQAELYHIDDQLVSAGIAPYTNAPPTESQNQYDYYKLRWLNMMSLNSVQVTAGVDYKSEEGDASGFVSLFGTDIPTGFGIERDTLAGFIDAQWSYEALTLFSGLRHDDAEGFASENTWKVGGVYQLSKQIRFFANIGSAFKLPSLYALSNNMIGNPDLKPEQATNKDIGIEWQSDSSELNASIFFYHYKNLVDFDGQTFSLVNRSNIEGSGVELFASHQLSEDIAVEGDITYVNLDTESGEILTGRPEWQGRLAVNYQVTDNIKTIARLNYVGATESTSLYSGEFEQSDLAAFNKVDVTTTWAISNQHTLDFYVQNIFDKNYQVAVGVPGPELGVGLQLSWHTN
ncbi:TonB-dependent receptor plug domain-containing protein [Alteromonas stellipolaris]|uniref:TonB-dependent receptor plug domain-containing protein n=1 Tax=Alteromonas stellipolaris TaxID=233316 RepID=UPI0026E15B96|nr:TonB-dependent receptor [Alteromonas stellipolaris]MDO6536643.1 TonB-dependent receptor [Alteromonas stellipolaris]MDO6624711.1 TonB-dependent receptor [Alteromonas stellipolaris]